MNPQAVATAIQLGGELKRQISTEQGREKLALKVEYLLIAAVGIILLFFAAFIFLVTSVIGGLDSREEHGFRSGAPTAFAVVDIPSQYLPIFLRAQDKYGVSWAVLAAICKTESRFGQDMGPSEAGAIGLMQFMPATWEKYKQDGDNDGLCDPYNHWDAVFSAANLLKADGFNENPREAVYCYNHAWWYVDEVMSTAAQYSSAALPVGNGMWPLPAQYSNISSSYGNRFHPILQEYRFHDGIDIPAPEGAPVFAVQDGHVDWDREKGGYGLCVVLDHGGCRTLYAHLSDIAVKNGDGVKAGQVIGYVGSTGLSEGPHLHFSVYVNDSPCNPEEWLAVPSKNS